MDFEVSRILRFWVFGCILGSDGWGAPRLKDAALSEERLRGGYTEVQFGYFRVWDFRGSFWGVFWESFF